MALYVMLIGPQGAGKGVQAGFIHDRYEIPHISTGDLFRAMRTREDDLARKIQQEMAAGRLISDEITNEVVRERLEQPDAANGVIFDGYPRSDDQAAWLEQYLSNRGEQMAAVLVLNIDLYTAFKRAFGRVGSPTRSGVVYNVFFDDAEIDWEWEDHPDKTFPPRLKAVEKSSGQACIRRPDDASASAILKRIDTYLETTEPLIQYYREHGLLHEIAADQPIATVSQEIQAILDRVKK